MLEADGYIYSTVGRGSFVSDKLCQDEAEKIAARQELKSALKKSYKKGVTKEEIVNHHATLQFGHICHQSLLNYEMQ